MSIEYLDNGLSVVCIPGQKLQVFRDAAQAQTRDYAETSLGNFLGTSIRGEQITAWQKYRDNALRVLAEEPKQAEVPR